MHIPSLRLDFLRMVDLSKLLSDYLPGVEPIPDESTCATIVYKA